MARNDSPAGATFPGWLCAWLMVLALLPFLATRHAPEVHDDVVLRGPGSLVADPNTTLATLWTADLFGTPEQPVGASGFWRPAKLLVFRAQWWLTGGHPAALAWVGHVGNLLAHALATVLLALLLTRAGWRSGVAFLVAAVFATHPLQAESVAWISAGSNVYASVCGFGALALLLDRRGLTPLHGVLALLAILTALLLRESALLLAALIFATLLLTERGRIRCGVPLAAVALWGVLRLLSFEGGLDASAYTGPESQATRWLTWLSIQPELVRLLLWPGPALPLHAVPEATSWQAVEVLAGAGVLVVLLFLAAEAFRRRCVPVLLALLAVLGTAAMLAPWTRFPTGFAEVAAPLYERYLHVAVLAPALLLGWLAQTIIERRPAGTERVVLLVGSVIALALAPVTAERCRAWSSDEAFAQAGLEALPESAELWNHLGVARMERFRQQGDVPAGRSSLAAFERALGLAPGHPRAALNRFLMLAQLGHEDDAAQAAETLLSSRPRDPGVLGNLGWWHAQNRRWQQAAELFERALATGEAPPGVREGLAAVRSALQESPAASPPH